MSKIFLGDIADESARLLEKYLKKYMPDADIDPLKPSGIKGKMKNKAGRPDVVLVILDERLYDMCKGVAGNILSLPKVHKYDTHEGFKKFLESKFGVLDSVQEPSPEPVKVPEPEPVPIKEPEPIPIKEQETVEIKEVEPIKKETPTPVIEHKKDTVAEELQASLEKLEVDDDFGSLTVSDAEDTSNDKDKDDIIRKLNDDIIAKDMMIRNLEAQVEEKSGSRDVSHFVARIKALEEELDNTKKELSSAQNASFADLGKVTRAEQILDTVDSLKEELKQEKEKCLLLEASKSSLTTEILSKKSELQKVTEELETSSKGNKELTSKVSELEETISSLQSDYDLKVSELEDLTSKNKDLDEKVIALTSQVAEIGVLNDKVDSLSSENKNLQTQVSDLSKVKIDLENLRIDYDRVSSEKDSLSQRVNDLQSKLNDAIINSDNLTLSNEKLERDINSLTSDNESLSSQLNEISSKLSSKDDEIEELLSKVSDNEGVSSQLSISNERVKELEDEVDNLKLQLKQFEDTKASLSDKISEVETLQQEVDNLKLQLKQFEDTKASLSDKISEVEELQNQLRDKTELERVLSQRNDEISSIKSELADKVKQLNSLTEERKSQSSVVEEKDSELASKISEVSRLTEEVKDLSSRLDGLQSEKDNLDSDNKKLKNEIEALRKNATDSQEIIQNSSELEKEMTECKRTIARLQSENTSLKDDLEKSRGTTNKDVEISKLRSEISDYKEKLRVMKDNNSEQSDEVSHLREKCAGLEVSIVEKENQLKENESSNFSRMGNIALPKTVFNLSLDVPDKLTDMYVFASGSSESNLVTYQVLRRLCSSINKQVLILDLVTDSYIDREFGVDKIQSPIEFLQCKRPINDFVSRAKVGNTFVSSTAVNYLNSLFLLTVDWNTVLPSLVGKTDIVIINIGCLNDVVSKVLFNAFASVMQSHIIIKASPINLRTALLTLSGISSAKKSKISCVNFENSSKDMYQKLAQKFNTQILKDSDVLKL